MNTASSSRSPGSRADELDITAQQNVLIVSGRKKDETEEKSRDYIYRGIANRSFERRFALADHIQVTGADRDGLLAIDLVREIPEAMKPKKINIGGSAGREHRRSAAARQARVAADRRRRRRARLRLLPTAEMRSPGAACSGAFLLLGWRSAFRPIILFVVAGPYLAWLAVIAGWAWFLIAGGGGFGILLLRGPWPPTNGWFAL